MLLAFTSNSLADCRTHLAHILPGKRCLEGFGNKVIPEPKVSQVADHECQEIASLSILSASLESLMLLSNGVDDFLLVLDLQGSSFEEDSAEGHLVRVEAHDFSDEILLSRVHNLMDLALVFHLQGHSELELLVVQQSQTSRP